MGTFYKAVFALLIAVALGFWLLQKNEKAREETAIVGLSELMNVRPSPPAAPVEPVQKDFLRSLAYVKEHALPLKTKGLDEVTTGGPDDLIHKALDRIEMPAVIRGLTDTSFQEAYNTCERMGIFENPANLATMADGLPPTIMRGTFAGQQARVGFRLSPILSIEVKNHPANFVIVPAPLWSLQGDEWNVGQEAVARRFADAKLISPNGWAKIQDAISASNAGK